MVQNVQKTFPSVLYMLQIFQKKMKARKHYLGFIQYIILLDKRLKQILHVIFLWLLSTGEVEVNVSWLYSIHYTVYFIPFFPCLETLVVTRSWWLWWVRVPEASLPPITSCHLHPGTFLHLFHIYHLVPPASRHFSTSVPLLSPRATRIQALFYIGPTSTLLIFFKFLLIFK